MRSALKAAFFVAIAVASLAGSGRAQTPLLASETYKVIPPNSPNTQLFIANKHPEGFTGFRAERTVLFLHGAGFPAESTFDLQLSGTAWMDFIAVRGFDVYYVDLEGFGRSTRPLTMSVAPAPGDPVLPSEEALRQVESAIASILERRRIDRLNLIGFDWGATLAARFAVQNPRFVERLVLYAPPWVTRNSGRAASTGANVTYLTAGAERIRADWLAAAPEAERQSLLPRGWFEAFWVANMTADPVGAALNPQAVRSPAGPALDYRNFWDAGRSPYDPGKLTAPVLIVHGAWDNVSTEAGARDLANRIGAAAGKSIVTIPGGTHLIMIERNRLPFFDAVQRFLEAGGRS